MTSVRKSLVLVSVAIASLLTFSSAAPTQAQAAPTIAVPLTVWDIPSATALDAYGGWLVTGNDPTAGVGQADPSYEYFHEVYFSNSDSFADLSLVVDGGQKYAVLTVADAEEDRVHTVRLRYPWMALRYYFLYMARLAPGVWGSYIHDASSGVWTTIGHVLVPDRLHKLEPFSATGVGWIGPQLESCTAYPLADIYRMKPLGVVGQTPLTATAAERHHLPADCPTALQPGVPTADFDHYTVGTLGSDTAAVTRAEREPSRADERRPYYDR